MAADLRADLAGLDSNRAWQLAAARGDITSEGALEHVRAMRELYKSWAHRDPEMAEALAQGDRDHRDDQRRWHPPPGDDDIPPIAEAFPELDRTDDDGQESPADRMAAALLDTDAVLALPPPDPLIDDYLMRDSLAVLFAPSGAGKTFLALDWALHVAALPWWNHHDVHGGPVVYVIAEGASGIGKRITAWVSHHVTQLDGHPIHWLPRAVNLTDLTEVYAFIDTVRDLGPVLVVFDTLARCIVGADENAAKDIGLVVENLERIRRATGACVLCVHHTGKDVSAGSRGHSSLKGALDTEVELSAVDERLTVKVPKQKDGPEPKPLHLTRIPSGDSCVLVPTTRGDDDGELGAGAAATLETLRTIHVAGGIATSVWEAACEAGRSQFYVHRSRLLNLGLVLNVGTEKQPKYSPASAEAESDPSSSPGTGPVSGALDPPDPDRTGSPQAHRTRTGPGPDRLTRENAPQPHHGDF